jgi:2-aminoadipate transaminase
MNTLLSITQTPIPPGFIDLGLGDPGPSVLPLDLIRKAAETCFAQQDPSFLQYGAEQGNVYLRQELAKFLSKGYDISVDPASLFITNGSSLGLHLLCTLLTRPGDTVFVEEPTYFLALHILADHDLKVISIPTDQDGLVTDALEEMLKIHHPVFLYVIPSFQNPTGYTLSQERRNRLVNLCKEHDFIILADEVYQLLNYSSALPKPFVAYSNDDRIISINSFSKILGPGLRLGWIQASSKMINRLVTCALLDSGGGLNPFTSAIIRFVIASGGLESNIDLLKAEYSARITKMDRALHEMLPEAEYTSPQGGFFFWLRLPGVNGLELQKQAHSFKVNFRPGIRFSSQQGLQDFIRLSFVYYPSEEIVQGVIRLKEALASM